jgi:aspartate ammonia-lyase
VHPLNDVNLHQSTNDVYPTALRIAAIRMLRKLSAALAELQEELQKKENEFSDILRLGRTELMDALPMLVGQGFGAYAQAIARDRWRVYKVEERLRQINLGGTAIGTGMNAPNKYIFMITDEIQNLTGLGLARAEFPMDITQNTDVFVEVSGLLKACSVNLMKISSDLRLLASGPRGGFAELLLPDMQAGSTIMPGKVNPVIPEMVAQVAMKVMANDYAITMASSSGQLELNAFMPLIAESLLESLELLEDAVVLFREKCIADITVNEHRCRENVEKSTVLATALTNHIGYDKAAEIAKRVLKEEKTVREILLEDNILSELEINKILNMYEITKPGIPGK